MAVLAGAGGHVSALERERERPPPLLVFQLPAQYAELRVPAEPEREGVREGAGIEMATAPRATIPLRVEWERGEGSAAARALAAEECCAQAHAGGRKLQHPPRLEALVELHHRAVPSPWQALGVVQAPDDGPSDGADGGGRNSTLSLSLSSLPWGTHVARARLACAGTQHACERGAAFETEAYVVFDVVPQSDDPFARRQVAEEAARALAQGAALLPDGAAEGARERTRALAGTACFFGGLDKLDGVKTAAMAHARAYLAAGAASARYISTTNAVNVDARLARALGEAGLDVTRVELGRVPRGEVRTATEAAKAVEDVLRAQPLPASMEGVGECEPPGGADSSADGRGALADWASATARSLTDAVRGCSIVAFSAASNAAAAAADKLIGLAARAANGNHTIVLLEAWNLHPATTEEVDVVVAPAAYVAQHTADVLRDQAAGTPPLGGYIDAGEEGYVLPPVRLLRPGVDLSHFSLRRQAETRARRARGAAVAGENATPSVASKDAPPFTFAYVGRLSSEKSPGMALRALALARASLPRVGSPTLALALAGTGPMEAYLRAMAIHLNVSDCVSFVGQAGGEGLVEHLERADALLFPSLRPQSETFGYVAIEAMAMELPVVNFGLPATADWALPASYLMGGARESPYARIDAHSYVASEPTSQALAELMVRLATSPLEAAAAGARARTAAAARFNGGAATAAREEFFVCLAAAAAAGDRAQARLCGRGHDEEMRGAPDAAF